MLKEFGFVGIDVGIESVILFLELVGKVSDGRYELSKFFQW
jgi:hypothetical protein